MHKLLLCLTSLATMWFVGCKQSARVSQYTETQIRWSGATAEEIHRAIIPYVTEVDLVVIHDGNASLYQLGDTLENEKDFTNWQQKFPNAMTISKPSTYTGDIPSAPKREDSTVVEFIIDKDKVRSHGLTMDPLIERLKAIAQDGDLERVTKELSRHSIETPSNLMVQLSSFVKPELITVTRPIIIQE